MKRFFTIILVCLSLGFAACEKTSVDSKITEVSTNADKKISEIVPQVKPTITPSEQSPLINSNKCQPKNVRQNGNSTRDADDETISIPENREQFNDWLNNIIGSVKVATLANRTFISDYYWEGDLNNDGCRDIAILVEGIKDKSGVVSMDNFASGTTVQNLRSKAIYLGGDTAKLPFSDTFARQIKPQQKTAVAIVFGGQKGWSWKNNAAGREFLVYDSVFPPPKISGYEAVSLIFSVVEKSKPEVDYDDLIYRFPPNAVGDCVYTATEVKHRKNVFSELSNKFLICYDGEIFFNKKLPDSKSYPEL